MLSGVAIGEAAIAGGAGNVSGSGAVVAESIAEPISAADGVNVLAILIGAVVEGVAADASATAPGAPVGEVVFDVIEVSAFFFVDGLWVTRSAAPLGWHLASMDPDDWEVIAAVDDLWIKQ